MLLYSCWPSPSPLSSKAGTSVAFLRSVASHSVLSSIFWAGNRFWSNTGAALTCLEFDMFAFSAFFVPTKIISPVHPSISLSSSDLCALLCCSMHSIFLDIMIQHQTPKVLQRRCLPSSGFAGSGGPILFLRRRLVLVLLMDLEAPFGPWPGTSTHIFQEDARIEGSRMARIRNLLRTGGGGGSSSCQLICKIGGRRNQNSTLNCNQLKKVFLNCRVFLLIFRINLYKET
uniref:Uncharacterized protein n=1 Tax=Setaria viridis TaxID=4556 RepID=A0A4U6TH93_SETVI|nr:hypothetical protein SEVIR_8G148533v2 [Setaria viridis]